MSTTTTPPVTTQEQALTADASVPEWTPPSWDEIVREHTPRVNRLGHSHRLCGHHLAVDHGHNLLRRNGGGCKGRRKRGGEGVGSEKCGRNRGHRGRLRRDLGLVDLPGDGL